MWKRITLDVKWHVMWNSQRRNDPKSPWPKLTWQKSEQGRQDIPPISRRLRSDGSECAVPAEDLCEKLCRSRRQEVVEHGLSRKFSTPWHRRRTWETTCNEWLMYRPGQGDNGCGWWRQWKVCANCQLKSNIKIQVLGMYSKFGLCSKTEGGLDNCK